MSNGANDRQPGSGKRILVVDDEHSIVDAVATALRYEGYEVDEAATGREALSAVALREPDLIVLDWMLPDIEGIEVGRRLRAQGFKTAVLFLTAKDATENKVEALRAGGDDYVTKPFSLAEIVARIQAILRRVSSDLPGDVLRFADLVLDESRHEVFRGGERVELTGTEFALLRYLMLNPRRVLSRGQILQNVWRYDFGGNSNVVETYVSYLRKKLDLTGPPLIRTVRQAGYMLELERAMSRLSLRARLVLGVLALATAGLVTADVVIYGSISSFLVGRTDSALEADHLAAESTFLPRFGGGGSGGHPPPGPGCGPNGNGPDFIELIAPDGAVLCHGLPEPFPGTATSPGPKLPADFSIPVRPNDGPDRVTYLTVPALGGGGSWRVRASVERGSPNTLVLATPFGSVTSTLHRLLVIELLVTAAVLAALALLGLWLVRLGLRPLTAIGRTADLITGGDLSHRVERAEPRTEVGRLGLALNTMLDRIEASDARLRRFVADASHELRTPLAAVRAYAELFERGADRRPDDLARAMGGIARESARMSTLVDDLLLLARLDEGRPLEREPVALEEVAAEAVETARTVDPGRPFELDAEPLVVLGDRVRLRQVLDNLLANVRAHTPAGTAASVRVRAEGVLAVVEVSDSGPGLGPGERERVFERFYRPDGHRSRESGGAGLGLAIVAAIAGAHGGSVGVTSEAGAGATFRVSLPLADPGRARGERRAGLGAAGR